jgi:hypothetical protein
VVKISPEWVMGPEQGKASGRIATFTLWTAMFKSNNNRIWLNCICTGNKIDGI